MCKRGKIQILPERFTLEKREYVMRLVASLEGHLKKLGFLILMKRAVFIEHCIQTEG
jgi:hypothetical protein